MGMMGIVLGGSAVLLIWIYNSLISKKNEVKNSQGGLDASLKQRYDLIPGLVAATKEFMTHERSVLTQITELRNQALQPGLSHKKKQEINQSLSAGLGKILVSMESYPDLKSNTNMLQLQKSLHECEENIAASRRFYNTSVTNYNNALEMFPTSIFANMMGLEQRPFFEIPEAERANISVKELFSK